MKLLNPLLTILAVLASGCVTVTEPEGSTLGGIIPAPESAAMRLVNTVGNPICGAFATGPREVTTAAHCLIEETAIRHPVDRRIYVLEVVAAEHQADIMLDRARLTLPPEAPSFEGWYTVRAPREGETATLIGTVHGRNLEGITWKCENDPRCANTVWVYDAPVISGDSGSVIVGTDGAAIGTLSNLGSFNELIGL